MANIARRLKGHDRHNLCLIRMPGASCYTQQLASRRAALHEIRLVLWAVCLTLLSATAWAGPDTTQGSTSSHSSRGDRGTNLPQATAELQAVPPSLQSQLTRCINNNQPEHITTTWEKAIHDVPGRYQVLGMFWSAKNSTMPLTIATQLSYTRKWQLKAMCKSWPGPISAVMHMPSLRVPDAALKNLGVTRETADRHAARTRKKATAKVAEIHEQLDFTLRCKLDLMLVFEQYADHRSMLLYPVNTLRNMARLQARTPLVGLIDVDVLLSASLSLEMDDAAVAQRYVREAAEQRKLWVLPAFATNDHRAGMTLTRGMHMAEKLVRNGKALLHPLFKKDIITRFDPSSSGHVPTDYDRWFKTRKPYTVQWQARYEPWVITDRVSVPWADMRFRGYGKNKIVILQALNNSGYQFEVHPNAFLVHRSHPSTSIKALHSTSAVERRTRWALKAEYNKKSMFGHNAWLADMIKKEMDMGTYQAKVDPFVTACLNTLPWWRPQTTAAA